MMNVCPVSTRTARKALDAIERRFADELFRQRRDAALLALDRARRFAVAGERLTLGQIASIMNEDFGTKWTNIIVTAEIRAAKRRQLCKS